MTGPSLALLVPFLLAAYLVAAVPFGFLAHRLRTGKDIREEGSGNIGATNVLRTSGRGWAALVLLLDVLKGFAPVLAARLLWGPGWVPALTAVVTVLAHCFPVYLRLRGGKGVATGLGALAALAPWAVLPSIAVFLLLALPTRYVSLGSIGGAAAIPVSLWLLGQGAATAVLGGVCGAVIILRHAGNIARLVRGTERKLGEAP